jgi:hypothetical protein
MASDPRSSKPGDEGATRKGYHSPELRIYGDIRAITQAGSAGPINDHGGGNVKTG